MKYDFSATVTGLDKKPVVQVELNELGEKVDSEQLTYRKMFVFILTARKRDEVIPGEKKLRLAKLAEKIMLSDEPIAVSGPEKQLIYERAEDHCANVVHYLRLCQFLDPEDEAVTKENAPVGTEPVEDSPSDAPAGGA